MGIIFRRRFGMPLQGTIQKVEEEIKAGGGNFVSGIAEKISSFLAQRVT